MRTFMTLLILCIASLALGQTTFTDGTFEDADWTTTVFTLGYSGPGGSTVHEAVGGNPADHRAITTNMGDENPARVIVIEMRAGAIYDPSTQGIITFLSYGEDHKCAAADGCIGLGQNWWPTILQDGKFYIHRHDNQFTGVLEDWTTGLVPVMLASDFGEVEVSANGMHNLTSNPDFSASGGPIQFGYSRATSISNMRTGRIDNWTFAVNEEAVPTVDTNWGSLKSWYR